MASFKDSRSSRPTSQHRLSTSTAPLSVPGRYSSTATSAFASNTNRHHAHSISLGHLHTSHRVTRRKSISSNNLLSASVAAAVHGVDSAVLEALVEQSGGSSESKGREELTTIASSRPNTALAESYSTLNLNSDGVVFPGVKLEEDALPIEGASIKGRNRRASEGQFLGGKTEGRVARGELRCEKCGKGYKHSSCLTKHLWEHTPHWSVTSKLLISKHQQVQLLEAASVLVTMNRDPTPPSTYVPPSAIAPPPTASSRSSASPLDSSASPDPGSSAETTPPPSSDLESHSYAHSYADNHHPFHDTPSRTHSRSHSTAHSHAYSYSHGTSHSHAYQPHPTASTPTFTPVSSHAPRSLRHSSVASSSAFSHSYQSVTAEEIATATSYSSTGAFPAAMDDDAMEIADDDGLAAAVELCNFGILRSVAPSTATPTQSPESIPPVPPLPARYASHNATLSVGHMPGQGLQGVATASVGFGEYTVGGLGVPSGMGQRVSDERMGRGELRKARDEETEECRGRSVSRGGSEVDEGVFGNMEE